MTVMNEMAFIKNQCKRYLFIYLTNHFIDTQYLFTTLQPINNIIKFGMNIFNNNSEQFIQNKQGHLNVSGNHNVIHIRNSNLVISVNGNHNYFDLQQNNINLQVNGNNNQFKNTRNTMTYGFNGNNNQVVADQASNINCQYSNGNNRFPNSRNIQRPENTNRNRNRNSQPNNVPPRQFRNQNGYQNNIREEDQRDQRRFRHQQGNQGEQGPPRRGRGFIPQQQQQAQLQFMPNHMMPQQIGFLLGNNIFEQMDFFGNNMNLFGQRGRQHGFQMRPNHPVFIIQNEEQEDKALPEEYYELLPTNKHTGKPNNCTICLDDIKQGDEQTYLICFHAFHQACIKDWLVKSAKCPVCQFDLKQYFNKQ